VIIQTTVSVYRYCQHRVAGPYLLAARGHAHGSRLAKEFIDMMVKVIVKERK